jgi:hypothetical protein
MRVLCVLLIALIGTQTAFGGEPTYVTEKCPIGNESVTYLSTLGCSYFGGDRTMSLAPISSCDFIERMPQCPKSKLPLYREFSTDEARQLRALSKTEAYAHAAAISRFYLAYMIEKEIAPENVGTQLNLLVSGLWYDSEHTYQSDEYFRAFSDSMNAYTPTATQEEKDFLRAVGAYGLIFRGNIPKAKEIIAAIRKSPAAQKTFLIPYIGMLEACTKNPGEEKCAPDYPITLSE